MGLGLSTAWPSPPLPAPTSAHLALFHQPFIPCNQIQAQDRRKQTHGPSALLQARCRSAHPNRATLRLEPNKNLGVPGNAGMLAFQPVVKHTRVSERAARWPAVTGEVCARSLGLPRSARGGGTWMGEVRLKKAPVERISLRRLWPSLGLWKENIQASWAAVVWRAAWGGVLHALDSWLLARPLRILQRLSCGW